MLSKYLVCRGFGEGRKRNATGISTSEIKKKRKDADAGHRSEFLQDRAFCQGKYSETDGSGNIAEKSNHTHFSYHGKYRFTLIRRFPVRRMEFIQEVDAVRYADNHDERWNESR